MARKIKILSRTGDGSYTLEDLCAFNLFRAISASKAAAAGYAGAAHALKTIERSKWRGDAYLPPASPISDVCEAFRQHTDQPLDISFHTFLCFLAAHLQNQQVVVECRGQKNITPEIWTIILAPSGSGKTYASDRIANGAPILPNIGGIRSGAALFESLKDNEAKGVANFYYADEVAQPWRQMEQDGHPMQEVREILLISYGGGKLIRKTVKHGEQIVNESKTVFLGLNVAETFISILQIGSMLDGSGQRFGWCISELDSDRPLSDYPRYDDETIDKACRKAWASIAATTLHARYIYTDEAVQTYDDAFKALSYNAGPDAALTASFYRRVLQRTHKLALLYHILLGDETPTTTHIDVEWALRLAKAHIADTAKLII